MDPHNIERAQRVIARKARQTSFADNCWSLADYHPDCEDIFPVSSGGTLYIWCPECRVLAQLMQVAQRIEIEPASVSTKVKDD